MMNIKLVTVMIIILSSFLLGCVEKPVGTPTPTVSPTATATVMPTIAPTPSPTPTPVPTPVRVPVVYRSYVDEYGFYQVRALNSTIQFSYSNNTLMIHVGDTVQWISYSQNYTITIVSEQGLWSNTSAKLRWTYQTFEYTFNQTGTYGVYVMEWRVQPQTIIVNP